MTDFIAALAEQIRAYQGNTKTLTAADVARMLQTIVARADADWYDTTLRDPQGNVISLINVRPDSKVTKSKRWVENLQSISELAIECAAAPPDVDLFELIAEKLHDITGAIAASVSSYIPETQELVIQHIAVRGSLLSKANQILGRNFVGMHMPVSPEMMRQILNQMVATTQDLSETTFGTIPKPIAAILQKALGIQSFTGLSLQYCGELIGTAVIVIPKGQLPFPTELMEALAHVIAVALRRKKAEDALRESKEQLQLALEATHTGLWDWDIKTGKMYFGPRYYTMLGYTPGELDPCYDTWTDLIHPDDRADTLDRIQKHLAGEKAHYESQFRLRTKSGTWRWILGRGKIVERDHADQPLRMVGTHVDITERVQAQQERERLLARIQAQARQIQQIMDTVPEGVVLLDADGRLSLTNPAGQEAISILADAQVGESLTTLGSHPLTDVLNHHATQLPVEITLSSPAKRVFEVQARPIGENGTCQWVLTLRDVTKEREIQRQMQSQERLATVGQMAAGIAHDFNNIMASIVLYADMLLGALDLAPQEQHQLETIRRQGHRAAHLVQQILDFSRRSVMERRPLDLVALLTELEKLLRRTLPEHIQLHFCYAPGEYVVNADPTHIQQVIMNLALNARDAMFHGGALRFALSRFTLKPGDTPPLHDMAPGKWVNLTVTDTGSGIPPDVLDHIFEPFFTTKEVGQGTGLGLAQVYGIIGQHGGRIGVDSVVGQGTTFTIYLPALPIAATDLDRAQSGKRRAPGYGETILVVEDDDTMRSALAEILEDLGYQVLTASNGQEALSLLGDEVTLVLSDLVMPKMGGVELYEHIKAKSLRAKMVVITGYPLSDGGKTLLEQGITAWVQKPFSSEKIAQVLHKALRI